jgi:hypothetical protein
VLDQECDSRTSCCSSTARCSTDFRASLQSHKDGSGASARSTAERPDSRSPVDCPSVKSARSTSAHCTSALRTALTIATRCHRRRPAHTLCAGGSGTAALLAPPDNASPTKEEPRACPYELQPRSRSK